MTTCSVNNRGNGRSRPLEDVRMKEGVEGGVNKLPESQSKQAHCTTRQRPLPTVPVLYHATDSVPASTARPGALAREKHRAYHELIVGAGTWMVTVGSKQTLQ